MSRPALVLRPAPGNAATAARLEAAGVTAIRLPLFAIVPVPWRAAAGNQDALLLTSANAVRHAGAGLAIYRGLPTITVGKATAEAARTAGLNVVAVGSDDAVAALALAQARGWQRIVRLAGHERTPLEGVTDIEVYASEPCVLAPGALVIARGAVALLHSTRAAERFATLIHRDGVPRTEVRLATISAKVAAAAGEGWARVSVASAPDDASLVAAAAMLAIDR